MKRFAILALVFLGCGGSDKTASMMMGAQTPALPSQKANPAAPGKCETLIATTCGRAADCVVAEDPSINRTEAFNECRSGARSALDCGAAVDVSTSFDRCIRELAETTCTALFADPPAMPKSCDGVIIIQ